MVKEIKTEEKNTTKKSSKKDYIHAIGRRREAVARVRLYPNVKENLAWGEISIKKGDILVNLKPASEYFNGEKAKTMYTEPLRITNTLNRFAVTARTRGGGLNGQLDALILAISRALSLFDKDKFRPILKKRGFLTRDARARERRKVGTGGKARRAKQSPKR